MRHAPTVAIVISLIGLCLLTVGIALVYPPAGLIALGAGLTYFGLVWMDVDGNAKKRRGSR